MSIIVSVYLKEGIVMSADSRLTGITPCKDGVRDQYTVSDNGQKREYWDFELWRSNS